MGFVIIFLCAFFSCAKVTAQGRLARQSFKNTDDAMPANCLIFALTALMFSVSLAKGVNINVIRYSVLFGVLSASFQVFYAMALKTGPFSITCMLINLGMIVPSVFSIAFLGEKLTVMKVIGFILCVASISLSTKGSDEKINVRWLFYVFLAFFSTGGNSVVQKLFAKSELGGDLSQFIFWGYLIAFLLTLIFVTVKKIQKRETHFKVDRNNIILIIMVVVCLGAFQYFFTTANIFTDAIVLNPSVGGLSTIFSLLSGRLIFGEKLTARQLLSIYIGIAAIVFISLYKHV